MAAITKKIASAYDKFVATRGHKSTSALAKHIYGLGLPGIDSENAKKNFATWAATLKTIHEDIVHDESMDADAMAHRIYALLCEKCKDDSDVKSSYKAMASSALKVSASSAKAAAAKKPVASKPTTGTVSNLLERMNPLVVEQAKRAFGPDDFEETACAYIRSRAGFSSAEKANDAYAAILSGQMVHGIDKNLVRLIWAGCLMYKQTSVAPEMKSAILDDVMSDVMAALHIR